MNFLSPSKRKRKLIEKKKRRIQSFPSDEEEEKEHALDDYFDNSSVDSDRYSFVSSESYERSTASDKARPALNADSPESNSYDKYAIHEGDNETQTPPPSPKDTVNIVDIDTKTLPETPKDDSTPKARPQGVYNTIISSPESPQDRYAINDQEEPLTPTSDKYILQQNDKVTSPGSGAIVSAVDEEATKTTPEPENIIEEDKTTPETTANEEEKQENLSPVKETSTPTAKPALPPAEEDEESPLVKRDKYATIECTEQEQTDLESDSPQNEGGEPKSLPSTPNKSDAGQHNEREEEETEASPSATKDGTVTALSPTKDNDDDGEEDESSVQNTSNSSEAVAQEDKESLIQNEVDHKETEATESNTPETTSEENDESETNVDDPETHEARSGDAQGQDTESKAVEHDPQSAPEGEKILDSTKEKDAISESEGTATHTLEGRSTHSSDDDHTYEKLLLDVQKNCSFDDDSEISDLEDDMDFDFMTCEFLRYLDDKENNTSGGDLERFSPRDPQPRGKSVLSPRNRSAESPSRSAPNTPIGRFDDKSSPARKHSSVSLSEYIGITPHNTPQKRMDDAPVENTQETTEPPQSSSGDSHKRENSEDGQFSNTTLSTSSGLQGIKIMDEQSSSTVNAEVVPKSPVSLHPYDEVASTGATLASEEGESTTTKSVAQTEGTADGPAEETEKSPKEGENSKAEETAAGPAQETSNSPKQGDSSIEEKPRDDFASVLSPGSAIPHDDAYSVWRAKGLMSPEKKTPTPKTRTTPRKTTPVTPRQSNSNKKVTFPAVHKETTPTTMRLRKEWRRFPTKKSSTPGVLQDFLPKQHKKIKIDAREFSHLLREWKRTCLNSQYEILPGGILSPLKEPSRKRPYRRSWPKQSPTSTPQNENDDKADNENDASATDFCPCSMPFFSGNEDMIDFFLPKLGVSCTCGKQSTESYFDRHDPTSLENILRPWQVTFLKSFGIRRGDQFVKAHHKHAGVLARAMRVWRMRNDMIPVRTVSCGMALHIWSRTCKIHVRSIRRQVKEGVAEIKPPTALEVLSTFLVKVDVPEERRLSRQLLSPPVKGALAGIDDSHAEV